ncbi:LuxR C-terminal-related transcriptional regulator [Paenibacillus tuaregi]|uniref:LuxR C-terminal-related transcriptional regulator n=1 Tax=Paenibacillus tuaregi TaxID=1816681 RepID=UPI000837B95A|nr:LuxR C-terminal-related transcriptional regulator [Paenibacillus tuaregi]
METIRDVMIRLGAEEFTGRVFECQYFGRMLEARSEGTARILNVYGTGGIGKTTLLARFGHLAGTSGARFMLMDMRDYMGNPSLFMEDLASKLGWDNGKSPRGTDLAGHVLEQLNRSTEGKKVVLALDQYEEAGSMDPWLRETFLPGLRSDLLIVIAGRYPLGGPWKLSPIWRRLIISLPLAELQYEEARAYLRQQGVTDESLIDQLWLLSSGHPLSLSLLAVSAGGGQFRDSHKRETLAELLQYWLEEVPDEILRSLVYAASIPRSFDLEMLQRMMEAELPDGVFERLIKLSFVCSSARGWQLHDLVRDAARQTFRERQPDTFTLYLDRLAVVLNDRIHLKLAEGTSAAPDIYELISHSGHPILRAHFRYNRSSANYWEPVTEKTLPEMEKYIERRKVTAKTARIVCANPDNDEWFHYKLTAEESLLRLSGWDSAEVAAFGLDSFRLLRGPDGDVLGLAVMPSVRADTLAYLLRNPLSAPFFRLLPEEHILRGNESFKFVFAVDVLDPESRDLRSDSVNLIMEHVLSGTCLAACPPALPFFQNSHISMGFEPVIGIEKPYIYRTGIHAAAYQLDTRGRKLEAFLKKVARFRAGNGSAQQHYRMPQHQVEESLLSRLTPRELEVAEQIARGFTNKEIASSLFVSEAAVKKHLNAMLQKTGLKNRTQLAAELLKLRVDRV